MAQLFLLCSKVMGRGLSGLYLDRNTLDYPQTRLLQGLEFIRVIGYDTHLAEAEVEKYLGTLLIVSGVDRKAELLVSFDRVGTIILKSVCADLI